MSEYVFIASIIVFAVSNSVCFWLGARVANKENIFYEKTEPMEIIPSPEDIGGMDAERDTG